MIDCEEGDYLCAFISCVLERIKCEVDVLCGVVCAHRHSRVVWGIVVWGIHADSRIVKT